LFSKSENLRDRGLLGWIWLDVLSIRGEPESERNVSDPLAQTAFGRIASRVRSLIASRSHWLTAPIIVITSRPVADKYRGHIPVGNQREQPLDAGPVSGP